MVHYATPLNAEPVFSEYVDSGSKFPEAERLSREALSLPIYPELEDSEVEFVCQQLAGQVLVVDDENTGAGHQPTVPLIGRIRGLQRP